MTTTNTETDELTPEEQAAEEAYWEALAERKYWEALAKRKNG